MTETMEERSGQTPPLSGRRRTERPEPLCAADFASDQEVRWCPGCGDYAILKSVQAVMPDLGIPRENIVFISGIGCSSRFPYYMNTYGMHTIHGRAPTIASGLRVTRPDLSIWVVTGDGDGLSIGGNHLIHMLRRNMDVNILLFNNRIYGLTKGQYSPTSSVGTESRSTPGGSIDRPLNPLALAAGAGATFAARGLDLDLRGLQEILRRAAAHKGTSFVEILQNCPVFNDGAFAGVADRRNKDLRQLRPEHGKPLLFDGGRRGIRITAGLQPEVVEVGDGPGQVAVDTLAVHDERSPAPAWLTMLAGMEAPVYDELARHQVDDAVARHGRGTMKGLLHSGMTWKVE